MSEKKPAWFTHGSYLVALAIAMTPVIKDWWTPDLISLEAAEERVKAESEAMLRLAMQAPLSEAVVFEDDKRGRLAFRFYADESVVQQRRFVDGHELYRYLPSLATDRHDRASTNPFEVVLEAAEQPGYCVDQRNGHGGQPKLSYETLGRCTVRVTGDFKDGCQAVWTRDVCTGTESGIIWKKCQH